MIDRAVFQKLNKMRIRPSESARTGSSSGGSISTCWASLPTPEEVNAFLAEPAGERRDHVIDRLLARPEFYDFWALKFADVFRSNGRLIQTKGAYAFHRWIRESLERNVPMDQLVRALLTSEGSTFRNPAANYYRISRDPEIGRRDHGAAFPRASASSAPSATITRSSAGRRTIITALPPSSRRSAGRRATCPTRKSSTPPARATSASREPARR